MFWHKQNVRFSQHVLSNSESNQRMEEGTDNCSDWLIALIASSIRLCWPGGQRQVRSSQTICPLTFDLSSTCACWPKPCCPTLCHSTPLQKYCKPACSEVTTLTSVQYLNHCCHHTWNKYIFRPFLKKNSIPRLYCVILKENCDILIFREVAISKTAVRSSPRYNLCRCFSVKSKSMSTL